MTMTRLSGRLLIALLGLTPVFSGAAEPTWHLSLQLYSLHEHTTQNDLTNNTPGLGVMRVTENNWIAGAGIFRNSLARTAGYAYVGKEWPVGRVLVGGIAGVTHHYNFNDGGLVPLGGLLVTVPLADRWALDMIGIPRISGFTYNTLHFAVRWQFK